MSRFKRLSAAILAFALVICFEYFSFMKQTSAWFYDSKVIDSGDSFVFADLTLDALFTSKSKITFDGATKFADPEEILFDEVINVNEISVCNSGTVPARVYADAVVGGNFKGLRWFVYDDTILVDSSVKKTIESVLPELTDAALTEHNVGKDGNGGYYMLLRPGEIATLKVATWVEYDAVKDELANGGTINNCEVEISLIATQDVDGALER